MARRHGAPKRPGPVLPEFQAERRGGQGDAEGTDVELVAGMVGVAGVDRWKYLEQKRGSTDPPNDIPMVYRSTLIIQIHLVYRF